MTNFDGKIPCVGSVNASPPYGIRGKADGREPCWVTGPTPWVPLRARDAIAIVPKHRAVGRHVVILVISKWNCFYTIIPRYWRGKKERV